MRLGETVIVRHGAPMQILKDQGTNFDGSLILELCKLLGIDKVSTSSYQPGKSGLIKWFHRDINQMLGKVIRAIRDTWKTFFHMF